MNTPPNKHPDSTPPHWKEDFPIRQGDDAYVTRREFTKFLGLTSIAFLVGTAIAAGKKYFGHRPNRVKTVKGAANLKAGDYKLFDFEGQPCILIRLTEDRFVAYSQLCTHLNCPVHFVRRSNQLVCPCHAGYFSAENGSVIAGPPKRPLTQYRVELHDKDAWIYPKEENV